MSSNLKKTLLWIMGIIGIHFVLFLVLFFPSGKKENTETKTTQIAETVKDTPSEEEPQVVSKIITVPDKGNETTDVNISRKKINIYIIDEKEANTLPIVSFIKPEKFFPKTIAESVISALGERVSDAKIGEVRLDNSSVFIDIETTKPETPFGDVNGRVEEMILDCISYSILDNFAEFNTIYFTVNGEAYNSKNIKLDKDKPFIN